MILYHINFFNNVKLYDCISKCPYTIYYCKDLRHFELICWLIHYTILLNMIDIFDQYINRKQRTSSFRNSIREKTRRNMCRERCFDRRFQSDSGRFYGVKTSERKKISK